MASALESYFWARVKNHLWIRFWWTGLARGWATCLDASKCHSKCTGRPCKWLKKQFNHLRPFRSHLLACAPCLKPLALGFASVFCVCSFLLLQTMQASWRGKQGKTAVQTGKPGQGDHPSPQHRGQWPPLASVEWKKKAWWKCKMLGKCLGTEIVQKLLRWWNCFGVIAWSWNGHGIIIVMESSWDCHGIVMESPWNHHGIWISHGIVIVME